MFSSIENLDLIGFVVHEITFSLDALMIKHQRVWVSAKVSQQCSIDYMESWIKYGFIFTLHDAYDVSSPKALTSIEM